MPQKTQKMILMIIVVIIDFHKCVVLTNSNNFQTISVDD